MHLGTDQVRILLFRECEWRGRKLLFDSMTVEKYRNKKRTEWRTENHGRQSCDTCDVKSARDFEVREERHER